MELVAILVGGVVAALFLLWLLRSGKRGASLFPDSLPPSKSSRPAPASDDPGAPSSAWPEEVSTTHLSVEDLEASEVVETDAAIPSTPEEREHELSVLRSGLLPTRNNFVGRLANLFGKRDRVDDALLEELEETLITADVGVRTTQTILEELRASFDAGDLSNSADAYETLRGEVIEILSSQSKPFRMEKRPSVILVVGVNGVGKTTTIGKLAYQLKALGNSVLLAAGDTYRAAAVSQLEIWGRRVQCDVIKGKDRADPSSVIFDAIKKGIDAGVDCVIADTAGRLHTKTPLMEELKKIGRTVEKALGRPADHVLLVLDATTGQNAIQQAQMFRDALPLSGIVLTKLDGSAKGGVILGIVNQHKIPVQFIGVGERIQDLRAFDAHAFAQVLFEAPEVPSPDAAQA